MNKERLILLGQLKEAINSKEPNMQNHCIGIINSIIALEPEKENFHINQHITINDLSYEDTKKIFDNVKIQCLNNL